MASIEQSLQHEIPVPHTAITDIVEGDANQHPEAWSDQAAPLFGQEGHIVLNANAIGVAYDHTQQPVDEHGKTFTESDPPLAGQPVHARPTSTKAWLVNVYGSRWTESPRVVLPFSKPRS